jgi:hypothetical protein
MGHACPQDMERTRSTAATIGSDVPEVRWHINRSVHPRMKPTVGRPFSSPPDEHMRIPPTNATIVIL